jgi:hypothetical protein
MDDCAFVTMNTFNRIVALVLWLCLLAMAAVAAAAPLSLLQWLQSSLASAEIFVAQQQLENSTNFLIGQTAVAIGAVLLFGFLAVLEVLTARSRGVRIRTAQGGSAELDTGSISRRLSWRLDQLAEIVSVVPNVKAKGGAVDIRLEIETAPDVDVPMKTDEVVDVTRGIIEQDMGLKLGKLDVRMRYAPIEPGWIQ